MHGASHYIARAELRGASGAISPGPYRSSRELSLTGLVGSDIWRPPTFVGNPGSMLQRPSRLRTPVFDAAIDLHYDCQDCRSEGRHPARGAGVAGLVARGAARA